MNIRYPIYEGVYRILTPQTTDTLSCQMFFPPTCRNGSGLVSVDGQVFHVSESAADCFASTFSRPLSI